MQFKVPQFLEIEDKIFGPFTFKQFAYLAGGGGLCFILYKALGLLVGAIPIALMASLSLALAFYRPNGKPFIEMVEAAFKYLFQNKLYIWKKGQIKRNEAKSNKAFVSKIGLETGIPKLGSSKLQDLAWSLDVLDLEKNKKENQ